MQKPRLTIQRLIAIAGALDDGPVLSSTPPAPTSNQVLAGTGNNVIAGAGNNVVATK
jgi:hypothetical protein